MVQDLQVVFGAAAFVAAGAEPIVGQAKARRREQILAVSVIRERAGLADQRIDDVAIVHRMSVATHKTGQRIDVLVRIPDLNTVGEEPGLDLLADQATVHRVGVALNVHQTARIDAATHLQTRRQPRSGQVPQRCQVLGETIRSTRVPRRHGLL
jgi:hypothetical protein